MAEDNKRGWNAKRVAECLGISESTFRAKKDSLECLGFPKQNPVTHRWDGKAVNLWMDKMSGINPDLQDNAREQLRKSIHARATAVRHDQAQSQG